MSHSIQPLSWRQQLGFASRHLPFANKIGKFVRRNLGWGLRAAFWEFMRICLGRAPALGLPSGSFSLYQALRWGDPSVDGKIILEDQGTPKVCPDSLIVRCGLRQHEEQPWPIVWTKHRNAKLVSNSLALFNDKKELCLESAYGCARWKDDPASRTMFLPPPALLRGRWTSLVSNWIPLDGVPIYGHWLHDALPRLAILQDLPPDTGVIVPAQLKPIHWETLELLGIERRCRPTTETHLLVEEYHFSSPTSMIDCYNPYAARWMRQNFLPKADPEFSGPKKFFFARSGKRRSIENMDEVTALFTARGWSIVRDIDLSFAQTIRLFSQATDVCGFLGSNMSNVLFCSPGCRVTHWVPDIFLDGWIDLLAPILELNYRSIILSAGGTQTARPRVDLGQIEDGLKSAGY